MKKVLPILIAFSLLVVFSTEAVRADVYTSFVRVTQEGADTPFDGSFADGTGAAIRFILNDAADSVVVKIIPAAGGAAVKTLLLTDGVAGDNFVTWDGSSDVGPATPAPADDYLIELTAYSEGYSSYTVYFNEAPAIFTRGVTSVNNPELNWFGFIYAASGGGYVSGVARHCANGAQFGDVPGDASLTTTGIELGPNNKRYAATADDEGYVWVLGAGTNEVFRFHTDTLEVTRVDSIEGIDFGWMHGLDIVGAGVDKTLYITGYNLVVRMPIGTDAVFTGTVDTIAVADTSVGMRFWDAKVSEQGYMYVSFQDDPDSIFRGVSMYDIMNLTAPLTFADTMWTHFFADGDPVTLALWDGATASIDDDILYLSLDKAGATMDPSGIYEFTNLATGPSVTTAWEDPDNNTTSFRGTVTLDILGNLIYFENSNEHTTLISPPNGPNSFTFAWSGTTTVTEPGVPTPVVDISVASEDLDGDFVPDRLADTVAVIGVVNSVNLQTSNVSYGLQDATGGITLFHFGQDSPPLDFGDLVQVIGEIGQFNGLTQITPLDPATDVIILDSNQTVTSTELTITEFLADAEQYESMRIKLTVVDPLFDPASWPAEGSSPNLDVWDGITTVTMRIDSDTEIDGSPIPDFPAEVSGTAGQFDSTPPYDTGYQILPSFIADFVPIDAPPVALFELLTPVDGGSVVVDDSAQVVQFSWESAIDFNEDVLLYNWFPIGFSARLSDNNGADTVLTLTGEDMLAFLGAEDSVTFQWTVQVKDAGPPVTNTDTSTVTVIRGTITGIAEGSSIPKEFYLHQNYPNPFNPSTTIRYGLPSAVHVRLELFNILGQKVARLVDAEQEPGRYRVVLDAGNFASGTYFYILNAGDRVFKKKMLLVK